MTVGHHRPRNLPVGARPALCDICGVLWYNNKLIRKADGLLYCPDDYRGADSVTLAEANARDAAYTQRRDATRQNDGSTDTSTVELEITPEGALSDNLSAWWSYRQLKLGAGVAEAVNIPQFLEKAPGNLFQASIPLRPAFDGDNDITFDGSNDYLLSTPRPLIAAGAFPSLFVVGSFADPLSATASTMVSLTDVGEVMTYTQAVPNRVFLQAQSCVLTASFTTSAGIVAVTCSFSSTALHLWQLEIQSDRVVLYQDGTQVGETLSVGSSLAYSRMLMGAGVAGTTKDAPTTITSHNGKCNEIALSLSTATSSQVTDMETYFKRGFPELTIS